VRRTLIVGIGNTLRSDDGAGVWAAARIAEGVPEAQVISLRELTPDLAERLEGKDLVLFLDASARASRVQVTPLDAGQGTGLADTHRLTPEGILRLANILYGWEGKAELVEIPAFDCQLGEKTSSETLEMIDQAVHLVSAILRANCPAEDAASQSPSVHPEHLAG